MEKVNTRIKTLDKHNKLKKLIIKGMLGSQKKQLKEEVDHFRENNLEIKI